jgi:hypothetical protein
VGRRAREVEAKGEAGSEKRAEWIGGGRLERKRGFSRVRRRGRSSRLIPDERA